MQSNANKTEKLDTFVCWNDSYHADYGPYEWAAKYPKNAIVFCPQCNMPHKITKKIV